MPRSASLKVQRWGNSLAIRIPSSIARSAGFRVGRPVEITPHESGVLVTPKGDVRLTLAQMLEAFDPKLNGGEAMATAPVGKEKL
jgi:antitoxin MazE